MPAGRKCIVEGCSSRQQISRLKFMRFPRDPDRRVEWTSLVNREGWTPNDYSRICELHFSAKQWERTRVDGTRKLKGSAVPDLFFNKDCAALSINPDSLKLKIKEALSRNINDVPTSSESVPCSSSSVMHWTVPTSSLDILEDRVKSVYVELVSKKKLLDAKLNDIERVLLENAALKRELQTCKETIEKLRMEHSKYSIDTVLTNRGSPEVCEGLQGLRRSKTSRVRSLIPGIAFGRVTLQLQDSCGVPLDEQL